MTSIGDVVNNKILLTAIVGLLVALVVSLIVAISGRTPSSKSSGKPTFLIVGPSYSGKTSLFNHLTAKTSEDDSTAIDTVTSQSANRYEHLKLPIDSDEPVSTEYSIVDLPGHSKLWHFTVSELEKHRRNLVGIIYMVDAASGQKGISQAAGGLYRLLQLTERRAGGVSILIACNKSDVFNVISTNRLKTLLETEINELRNTREQTVGEVKINAQGQEVSPDDDDSTSGGWIGLDGKDFDFTHLEGDVDILDGSVKAGRTSKWETWLAEKAVNTH